MLNCSHPDCILHHHHYYHGQLQHHLQDDRAHHEHPTHHAMSGETDGAEDSIIQGYLNDTNSELSSLSHLDAPNESVYMICGVLIAMLLVGLIIILLAITIRLRPTISRRYLECINCRKCFQIRKLRKREESSGVLRTNVVHPEGVLQAPVVDPKPAVPPAPHSLESVFISTVPDGGSLPFSPSDTSLSSCTSTESYLDSNYSLPMFLYSTGNSRNSLNSSSQSIPVHPCVPPDDTEKRKKHTFIKGLRRKKTPPSNHSYAIPIEYQDELKKIYVY